MEAVGKIERTIPLSVRIAVPSIAIEGLQRGGQLTARNRHKLDPSRFKELLHPCFSFCHGNPLFAKQPNCRLPCSHDRCDRPRRARGIERRRKVLGLRLFRHNGDDCRRIDEHHSHH